MREMIKKEKGTVLFPAYKYLNFDNAVMIGVVASYKAEHELYVKDLHNLDRVPRLSLLQSSIA